MEPDLAEPAPDAPDLDAVRSDAHAVSNLAHLDESRQRHLVRDATVNALAVPFHRMRRHEPSSGNAHCGTAQSTSAEWSQYGGASVR